MEVRHHGWRHCAAAGIGDSSQSGPVAGLRSSGVLTAMVLPQQYDEIPMFPHVCFARRAGECPRLGLLSFRLSTLTRDVPVDPFDL